MTARHAVYWVPAAHHPLWQAGCAWLGRDAEATAAGTPLPHRTAPWRYGFHATVKAPMVLHGSEAHFEAALAALARRHAPAGLPPFEVAWLRHFLALVPSGPLPPSFLALAAACVTELDGFRTPHAPAEQARRLAGLDAEGTQLATRWGYPHVLHRWQMHLTLSDAGPGPWTEARAKEARARFGEALAAPVGAGELAWFVEPGPGAPFRLVRRFALGAGA